MGIGHSQGPHCTQCCKGRAEGSLFLKFRTVPQGVSSPGAQDRQKTFLFKQNRVHFTDGNTQKCGTMVHLCAINPGNKGGLLMKLHTGILGVICDVSCSKQGATECGGGHYPGVGGGQPPGAVRQLVGHMSTGHRQRHGQCRFVFISTAFQRRRNCLLK